MPTKTTKINPLKIFADKHRLYSYHIAKILDISVNHMRRVLRGENIPRFELQQRIDDLLSGKTDWKSLLNKSTEGSIQTKKEKSTHGNSN